MSRARREVLPQAIELVHLYRKVVAKCEQEAETEWPKSSRSKLLGEVVEKFKQVTTEGVPLEFDCFDHWSEDMRDEVEVFRGNIQQLSKTETDKTAKWTKAVRKRDVARKMFKSEKRIVVEVWHLKPHPHKPEDIDTQDIDQVEGCTMDDTFDIVLLQWMMQDTVKNKAMLLHNNPHFYDNLEHSGDWDSKNALVFSTKLSSLGKLVVKGLLIVHCITDNDRYHPLLMFKHIPGWEFTQLCRLRRGILFKVTSGQLVDAIWYGDCLDPAVPIGISKCKHIGSSYQLTPKGSLSWNALLDEICQTRRKTEYMWIIENDSNILLQKDVIRSPYLSPPTSASSAQSRISFAPSEMTLVPPLDESVSAFKPYDVVNTVGSSSPQEPSRTANPMMPPRTLPHISVTHSVVPITSGRKELPSGSALIPQKSGDDVVATRSPNIRPPPPSPAGIGSNRDPTNDAVLPSADVHQSPESDGPLRPSLEPDSASTPLSEAVLNTEQSTESPLTQDSPQELKEKGWFTRVKEAVGAVVHTLTSGGTPLSPSHEEELIH